MLLALLALALLTAALVLPAVLDAMRSGRARGGRRRCPERVALRDPGRERRAEQRARDLLRSCVNDEEWAMYRDLGFIRIFGRGTARTRADGGRAAGATPATTAGVADEALSRPGAVEPARAPDATGA